MIRTNSIPDKTDDAQTVLLFYASSLPQAVGKTFQPPSPALLAKSWIMSSREPVLHLPSSGNADFVGLREAEARMAIRVVFDARVAQMNDDEMMGCVDTWMNIRESPGWSRLEGRILTRSQVPVSPQNDNMNSIPAATALFICGYIAVGKYSLLSSKYDYIIHARTNPCLTSYQHSCRHR
jgi:hypothetical protein